MERIKQLLLAHDWRFLRTKPGDVITRSKPDAPDDGQHMEQRRMNDRMIFRRGSQHASIGPGTARFWCWDKTNGQTEMAVLKTVQTEKIQALLDVRSPLTPAAQAEREKTRQERLIAADFGKGVADEVDRQKRKLVMDTWAAPLSRGRPPESESERW